MDKRMNGWMDGRTNTSMEVSKCTEERKKCKARMRVAGTPCTKNKKLKKMDEKRRQNCGLTSTTWTNVLMDQNLNTLSVDHVSHKPNCVMGEEPSRNWLKWERKQKGFY